MSTLSQLKKFVFDAILVENEFSNLEKDGVSVKSGDQHVFVERIDSSDFSPKIIFNAQKMASVYIVFFCLENAVRELISERLAERHGIDWWTKSVPIKIQTSVQKLKEKEDANKYHTSRSTSLIGYTMFGNLVDIIINRWEDFSDLFPNQHWVSARFNDLEMSRNIIMHNGVLPEIEIDRIESIARDWVRQVG